MLDHETIDCVASCSTSRTYFRSVSWPERSPQKVNPRMRRNSKDKSCLRSLPPLSITRGSLEEWPRAAADDMGVWFDPLTPTGSGKNLDVSGTEKNMNAFRCIKEKLAFFDNECSRICDHVYLGSDVVAKNCEILKKNGITHVLNCVGFVCPEYFKADFVYRTLWLQDSSSEDISSVLYDVFDYFEDVREQGGRVFVHCCRGISRSSSLVIAYLMWREGKSFDDAYQVVKTARDIANPNAGFAGQLMQCQKRMRSLPWSTDSATRMYRLTPHSSHDPLHLVPKLVKNPSARKLDSRGAFILHLPTAIFIWSGKHCSAMILDRAMVAANQVVRYERAKGPVLFIKEGAEPPGFWNALENAEAMADPCSRKQVQKERPAYARDEECERKVEEYDHDFACLQAAINGEIGTAHLSVNGGPRSCLPSREGGWCTLRQKLADDTVKDMIVRSPRLCHSPVALLVNNL